MLFQYLIRNDKPLQGSGRACIHGVSSQRFRNKVQRLSLYRVLLGKSSPTSLVLGGTCRSAKEPGTYTERQQMTARKPVPPSTV